jgi:winged helix domain-containing protein
MSPHSHLKALLKLADIAWSSNRFEDPAALSLKRKKAVQDIKANLRELKRRGGPGLLGDLMKKHAFTQKEGLILLMLLKRRISNSDAYLTGQKILKRLTGGSYEILRDLHLLRPVGRLRATQVVVPRDEDSDPEDILGSEFTLSAWAFRALGRLVEQKRCPKKMSVRPYRKGEDYLLDHLNLLGLLQKRANSLFELEEWEEVAPPGEVPARHIQSLINDHVRQMRARLDRTEDRHRLSPVRFVEKHGLDDTESQAVMALLFRELFQGESMAPVVELLKLVSSSKRDYLRNVGIFDTDRTLVKSGIIHLENPEEGRVFAAVVGLESWVVPSIITANTRRGPGLPLDAWQKFRRYLRELPDSDTFFRDMDRGQRPGSGTV